MQRREAGDDKTLTQADGARMAMAPQSSDYGTLAPMHRAPQWRMTPADNGKPPRGCKGDCGQGRRECPHVALCFPPLPEATLDRHNAERLESRTLPELLLAKGSMTGPFRKVDPLRNCPHRRVEWPARIAAAVVLAFLGWLAWRAWA